MGGRRGRVCSMGGGGGVYDRDDSSYFVLRLILASAASVSQPCGGDERKLPPAKQLYLPMNHALLYLTVSILYAGYTENAFTFFTTHGNLTVKHQYCSMYTVQYNSV